VSCTAFAAASPSGVVGVGFPTSQDFAVVIFFDNGWA